MKIRNVKIQYLTIASVLVAGITLSGMATALPSFIAAWKDYQATSEYENFDVNIGYVPKNKAFYEQAANQMSGMYPSFKFIPENDGLVFIGSKVEDHETTKFVMTELKAMEPGLFWSVSHGCLGKTCPEVIKFKMFAQTLTIDSKGNP